MPPSDCACHVNSASVRPDEQDLRVPQIRVSAEFCEVPGLKLTLEQAARFFSIEPAQCEHVLGSLVERGVLVTNGRAFARSGAGAGRA
jgi:hypothetical protein